MVAHLYSWIHCVHSVTNHGSPVWLDTLCAQCILTMAHLYGWMHCVHSVTNSGSHVWLDTLCAQCNPLWLTCTAGYTVCTV